MPPMEWIWLAALVFFSLIEAATTTLVSLWFIGGSLTALIVALMGGDFWLQILLFFLVSAILLLLLRPLAKKLFTPRTIATNAKSNIGKTAVVTERIDNLQGQGAVKIGGVVWSARSLDGASIEADTAVEIVSIEGVKVCVKPAKK